MAWLSRTERTTSVPQAVARIGRRVSQSIKPAIQPARSPGAVAPPDREPAARPRPASPARHARTLRSIPACSGCSIRSIVITVSSITVRSFQVRVNHCPHSHPRQLRSAPVLRVPERRGPHCDIRSDPFRSGRWPHRREPSALPASTRPRSSTSASRVHPSVARLPPEPHARPARPANQYCGPHSRNHVCSHVNILIAGAHPARRRGPHSLVPSAS